MQPCDAQRSRGRATVCGQEAETAEIITAARARHNRRIAISAIFAARVGMTKPKIT